MPLGVVARLPRPLAAKLRVPVEGADGVHTACVVVVDVDVLDNRWRRRRQDLIAGATARSDANAGSVGNPKAFAFGRTRDFLAWSQDTRHRVADSLAYFGNDHLRWRGPSAQSSFPCQPVESLS